MKKILILLMLFGTYLFVSVNLFASSYNDPLSNEYITLDSQHTFLGGHSLRQIFEGGNSFQKNGDGPLVISDETDDYLEITTQNDFSRLQHFNLTPNGIYYIRFNLLLSEALSALWITNGQFTNITTLTQNVGNWETYSVLFNIGNDTQINAPYFYDNPFDSQVIILLKNYILVDIDYYNLNNLSLAELDYYYSLYILFKNGLSPELYYDQGYDDGYDDGYDSGNLQGYSDGYDEGLFDYHTGNYYGDYDYTLSEPYNQATQANISLLSVFSLIIGVVMSMLGFIINIEMFGISIASVLGTLAIGVSIIWLLKLIRG